MQVHDMAERVIETLCADNIPVRNVPALLVKDWPDAQILDLVLAIATACDAVERMFGLDGPSGRRARKGWQAAVLIAADLRAMQVLDLPCARAGDLLAYWQAQDPYFLKADMTE